MRFILPYIDGLPKVTLQLRTGRKPWRYIPALIDSGAHFSIFSLSHAIAFGISLQRMKKVELESADGDTFYVYKTYLRAKFEKHEFTLPVGFSTKPDLMALVGRSGFFETFKIEFDELGKQTILRPYE